MFRYLAEVFDRRNCYFHGRLSIGGASSGDPEDAAEAAQGIAVQAGVFCGAGLFPARAFEHEADKGAWAGVADGRAGYPDIGEAVPAQ